MKSLLLLVLPLLARASSDGEGPVENIALERIIPFVPTPTDQKINLDALLAPPPTTFTTIPIATPLTTIDVGTDAHFPGFVNKLLTVFAIAEDGAGVLYNTSTGAEITRGNLDADDTARLVKTDVAADFFGVLYGDRNIDVFQNTGTPVSTRVAQTTAPCKIGCVQDFKITSTTIAAINGQRLVAWNWTNNTQIIADKFIGGADAYDIDDRYLVYLQRKCLCNVKTTVLKVIDLQASPTQAEKLIPLDDNTARTVILDNNPDPTATVQEAVLVGFSDFARVYALPDALVSPYPYLYRIDLVSPCSTLFFSLVNPSVVDEVDASNGTNFLIYRHDLPTGVITGFSVAKAAVGGPAGLLWQSLQIYKDELLVGGLLANDTTKVYLGFGTIP